MKCILQNQSLLYLTSDFLKNLVLHPHLKAFNSRSRILEGKILLIFVSFLFLISLSTTANALISSHVGLIDPTSEGFTPGGFSNSTVGPIPDDFGRPAWSIVGSNTSSSFGYQSAALSQAQNSDLVNNGFVLTLVARVMKGAAPTYSVATPYVFAQANLDIGTKRFDIFLGVDSNGDTVVVTPTSYRNSGASNSTVEGFGPNFTLIGSGSTYHTYKLVFNPQTQLADLFVDDVKRLQGYGGATYDLTHSGLFWGVNGGGQANFNFVKVVSSAASTTTSFDPASDFSVIDNPNGEWSYGWQSVLGSSFNLYAHSFINTGLDFWNNQVTGDQPPVVFYNTTGNTIRTTTVVIQPKQLGFHPGPSGEYSTVRWTAMNTGTYSLTTTFTGIDYLCGTTTDVHVLHNGVSLFDGLVTGPGNTSTLTTTLISIFGGDTIDFSVGFGSNRNYFCDSTGLAATINAISLVGDCIKTLPNNELTLEQNAQKTNPIHLVNTCSAVRSVNLEIINPHTGLTATVTEPNPISIATGETKSLSLNIDTGTLPVGVYDGLLLKVTVDDGSTLYSNIKVNVVPQGAANLPELTLGSNDISFAVTNPGDPVTLSAIIRNQGNSAASNVLVRFFEFGTLLGETVVPQVAANDNTSSAIVVPIESTGDHLIRVVIDPLNTISELNETNNEASQVIQPGGPVAATEGHILVSGSLPTTVYSNSLFHLSGSAVYDLLVNGARNTDYKVKGGSVQITVTGDNSAKWVYGDLHTDINGNLTKSLQAPATPGTYRIVMTVTDKTFIGQRELVFKVIAPPPVESLPPSPPTTSGVGNWILTGGTWSWLWTTPPKEPISQSDMRVFSKNIYFSRNHPAVNEEVTIFAEIQYWATNTDLLAEDIPINVYVTDPGNPRIKIGATTIDRLSVGSPDFGSRYVYATWKNRTEGIYLLEVEIDPSFVEENRLNNAATRAIIVGQFQSQQGAISGQVTDSWGSGIGNVIIQVFEADGSSLGSTSTDSAGFYLVKNVPLGEMRVSIETPSGYQPDAATKPALVADSSVSAVDFLLYQQTAPPVDSLPPVLSLPDAITEEATSSSGSIASYTATAVDGVDGAVTPICTPVSGSTFALGISSVTCSATDRSGNTVSGSFNVTVRDTTPPTLVCPADVSVIQGQHPNLGLPVASDAVDNALKLSNNAPSIFPVGTTAVIWTAVDAASNQVSCSQQVLVSQASVNQLPIAKAGSDQTIRQGSLVTLSGSGTDPDNGPSPLTFVWSQTSGNNVALNGAGTLQPTFTPTTNGSYTFRLVVNDGADTSAPAEVVITVPLLCDIDLDGDVDRNDSKLITAVRNKSVAPGDLRDFDGDGTVTVNDARSCVLKCTRSSCATQ